MVRPLRETCGECYSISRTNSVPRNTVWGITSESRRWPGNRDEQSQGVRTRAERWRADILDELALLAMSTFDAKVRRSVVQQST